jgi:hypothetical protein
VLKKPPHEGESHLTASILGLGPSHEAFQSVHTVQFTAQYWRSPSRFFSKGTTTHHRSRPRTSIYPKFASHLRTMANRKVPGFSNLANSTVENTSFGTHPQRETPPFITPLPPQITCSEIFLCAWLLTGATAHQSNNTVVRSASPYPPKVDENVVHPSAHSC